MKYIILIIITVLFFHNAFAQKNISKKQVVYYEAESTNNILQGNAQISNCTSCSGGAKIGYLGTNGRLIFNKIKIEKEDSYVLKVYYITSDSRSFYYSVNNSNPQLIKCEGSGNWNVINTKEFVVRLKTGINTITIDNPSGNAPDIDKISITKNTSILTYQISGYIKNNNNIPVQNTLVELTGSVKEIVKTNNKGYYEFANLPIGSYSVTALKKGYYSTPHDIQYSKLQNNRTSTNFTICSFSKRTDTIIHIGAWTLKYDIANGIASVFFLNKSILVDLYSATMLSQKVTSMDYKYHKLMSNSITDMFGSGKEIIIDSWNNDKIHMKQHFFIYTDLNYILSNVEIICIGGISTNYIAPIVTNSLIQFLPEGDNRALFVPYDNDMWVRYSANPYHSNFTSYEVSALYNNESRKGLIIGSIEHNNWKTGIAIKTADSKVGSLEIFGGVSSSDTHDEIAHGFIKGDTVRSPKIFIGYFDDWRDGLETYAKANAIIASPLAWSKGTPFGWNSWGKMQSSLSYDKAMSQSDFFKTNLAPSFSNDSITYIGLDSYWDKLTDEQLVQFVAKCKANKQEAGIYWAPFTDWGNDGNRQVEGSNYLYRDIYLYANGSIISLDGACAIDPTHPGTKQRINFYIDKFKNQGFKFIKLDFLTHGALESDSHFNQKVTTGTQAYNEGMQYITNRLGNDIYTNLSISPLFPSQYAQSRRISCDAFGDIKNSEYTLNSLSYGWWLNYVYKYNDADHVVLEGFSDSENRVRVTSSVITGIFISGDDLSESGTSDAKNRALKFLTNPDVNAIARIGKSFRPVEGNTGNVASSMFVYNATDSVYLAIFNYQQNQQTFMVNLKRIGINTNDFVYVKNLWNAKIDKTLDSMNIIVAPKDVVLLKFYK